MKENSSNNNKQNKQRKEEESESGHNDSKRVNNVNGNADDSLVAEEKDNPW